MNVARQRWPALAGLGAIAAFLVSRLLFLDSDVPAWSLAQYSPIDEFAYTVPAFNLVQYGTWVHQAAPWAPVEGLPMNAAQNVVTAVTLGLLGDDYWGFRLSSVVFGLVVFVGLLALVRQRVTEARRDGAVPRTLEIGLLAGVAVLLLVDFSSLLSGRIVEPTVSRLAGSVVVVYLVGRGVFLGEQHGPARSAVFGAVTAGAILLFYIYNLFLAPAALGALAWWAYRRGGRRALAPHVAAFTAGGLLVAAGYFLVVGLVYGHTPLDWYRTWIGAFASETRASVVTLEKAWSILAANVFRLDPPFLGAFLASVPIFAWSVRRSPTPAGVLLLVGLVFFVAQAALVADYAARKFLAIMLFAVPIVAVGALRLRDFQAWVVARRERVVAAGFWLAIVALVTAFEFRLHPPPPGTATLGQIIVVSGVVGAVAIVGLAVTRQRLPTLLAGSALAAAALAPLAYADLMYVYRSPTYTHRDAQARIQPIVGGRVTAGGWSLGMQLYNTSRPVLSGYHNGQTPAEYERNVVRLFAEGGAVSLFDYVDEVTRSKWASLGFRVVDEYDIRLPRGQILGRYVFEPDGNLEAGDAAERDDG